MLGGTVAYMGRVALLATWLLLAAASLGHAQIEDLGASDQPALVAADQIVYDEGLNTVIARGNVEIAQGERVLRADSVSYNLNTEVVTASGNVAVLEPNGDVYFAEYAELTDDLGEGFVRDIRVLMADNTRIAANRGVRSGGKRTEFSNAVFSPCDLCEDDPRKPPLWQLRALEVVHDEEENTVTYRDAWMEMFGVPIFYTPYFQHPDPTVDRQTGFLGPSIGSSNLTGQQFRMPFFWNIAPNQDLTFDPIFTTKQGVVANGEYRHRFTFGELRIAGSITESDREDKSGITEDDVLRGHIDATGRFAIDENWRAGFDVQRTSDDTYLRLYDFSTDATLTSRGFVERFEGRNYFLAESAAFQGQRVNDDDSLAPIVLPGLYYHHVTEPTANGDVFRFSANSLSLMRLDGRDTRRLAAEAEWQRPLGGFLDGDVLTVKGALTGGLYWTEDHDPTSNQVTGPGNTFDGVATRVFPQAALQWRYPWVKHTGTAHQVIEPIVQLAVAPSGFNDGKIPNEDSVDVEFDDTNLFSLNRFSGMDRVDSTQRVDYGLRYSATSDWAGYSEFFVGQSYRFNDGDPFPAGSGLSDHLSDVVGRAILRPRRDIDISYRFRFDKDDFALRRQEVNAIIGPPAFRVSTNYLLLSSDLSTPSVDDSQEELTLGLSTQINQFWSAEFAARRDLADGENRSFSAGLRYKDECFDLRLVGRRQFFNDREIDPEDSILLEVSFKHLGGFGSGN